ncbi:hypothetical protein ACSMX9_27270 [Streptomyces sp. LE64]|uniref:hypothetical protein n=1 Tax=Streptomyces sp. LE64 TaxID=3448653 RepID=UPI0040416B6C
MNGLLHTLRTVHVDETMLEGQLLRLAARHRADREIGGAATGLAEWTHDHLDRLAATGRCPGARRSARRWRPWRAERRVATPGGSAGLALLGDLRALHLAAGRASLSWELLAQAAQSARDTELLDIASRCHPQTLRQIRWTNTMIRNLAPQILSRT